MWSNEMWFPVWCITFYCIYWWFSWEGVPMLWNQKIKLIKNFSNLMLRWEGREEQKLKSISAWIVVVNALRSQHGIKHQKRVSLSPQQNIVRTNKIIVKRIRCMLSSTKLCKPFWGEGLCFACYLNSRSLLSSFGRRCSWKGVNQETGFILFWWCLGAKFTSICLKSKDQNGWLGNSMHILKPWRRVWQ